MGTNLDRDREALSGVLGPSLTLGKRKRKREADRVAEAVEAVTRALTPVSPEARVRVLRAVAALYDIPLTVGVADGPGTG